MSFFPDSTFLKNGKTYSQKLHLETSVNAENTTDAPEACDTDSADEPITAVSPDLIDEKIKANLEPLSAQISTLTQLLKQLIQDNSARNSPIAGPRTHWTQPGHSPDSEVGTSRTLPGTEIGSTGFLPDSSLF